MRTIRVFISSPGDVADERAKARLILEQLQKRYVGQLQLVPIFWEDLPLGLDCSFQEGIDVVLSERGVDIAVFIIWSRLGSPLGAALRRPDGSTYRSGTERELDIMLAARKASNGTKPALLAYVRDDADSFQDRMRGRPTDDIRQMIEQKQLAEQFVREQFHDTASGTNVRAYHTYDKPITYATRLRVHLQNLLNEIVQEQPGVVRWEGPPFRGLEAFDVEHASIFFGRESEVADVLLALEARTRDGCGAVVIAGASGSGKSSLVHAGVVPALVEHNLDDSSGLWRHLSFRPGTSGGDLLLGLARAIAGPTALPELNRRLDSMDDLARSLADSAETAYRLMLGPSLRALDDNDRPARLLIVVDQLEEVFTHAAGRRDAIAIFFRVLRVLAETDRVRVIATVRSDFYAECQKYDDLLALKAGVGLYDLLPPGPAALQQMIVRPAVMAGLSFERDATRAVSLDQRILNDAAEHPEALPLLQYALRELFENRADDRTLTNASYDRLGGVIGALSRRAEAVYQSLGVAAQESLGEVLNELVTVSESDTLAVARQRAPLTTLVAAPARREFVERFIAERLLVSDRGAGDEPVVSVAHESLLRAWDRAARWIEANRQFLAARARVQADLDRWRHEGRRDDYLIVAGKPLEDARALLTIGGDRLSDEQREYIDHSVRLQTHRQQRQLRRVRIAAAVFLSLAVMAGVVGAFAWVQKGRARSAERLATSERDRAQAESDKNQKLNAELEEQLYENRIAVAERELTTKQDIDLATSLLESCPERLRGWEWHYLMRLRDGGREPLAGVDGHSRGLWSAAFSPDGRNIVTASIDGSARIWDADTGRVERVFSEHNAIVLNIRKRLPATELPDVLVKIAAYSPDGRLVASGSITPTLSKPTLQQPIPKVDLRHSPGTVLIWDPRTGEVVRTFAAQTGVVLSLVWSPDGTRIASSSMNPEHTFVVWEAATGRVVKVVKGHTGHVYALRYSPDGKQLVSGGIDGVVKVWDAATLELVHTIDAHPAPVMALAFAPGGQELASAGQDGAVKLWDSRTFALKQTLRGHTGSALSVAYSPDGSRLASSGFDKTVRLWDPKSGRLKITLRGHADTVWGVDFSPDGRRLVSAGYDNVATVWDATPRDASTEPGVYSLVGHSDRVNDVAFSPDGKVLATSSWDNTVGLWDGPTGARRGTLKGHTGPVWGLCFSADSRRIATAGWDQTVRVWDAATGALQATLHGHEAPVHDVCFTPDGTRVVASAWDGSVRVWDIQTSKVVSVIDASLFPVLGIDISPDGKRLVCAGGDRIVSVWNLATGQKLFAIENAHGAAIYDVIFSPDGQRVISGGWDHVAVVWNADPDFRGSPAQRRLFTLNGHTDRVYRVAASRDGRHYATSSDDKTVRLWDAATGDPVGRPLTHRGPVWAVTFTPDGHRLASAAWTSSAWVRTWRID